MIHYFFAVGTLKIHKSPNRLKNVSIVPFSMKCLDRQPKKSQEIPKRLATAQNLKSVEKKSKISLKFLTTAENLSQQLKISHNNLKSLTTT